MSLVADVDKRRLVEYVGTLAGARGACLTSAFVCEGGARNCATHRARFEEALTEMRKRAKVSEGYRESLAAVLENAEKLAAANEQWNGEYEGVCIHVSQDHARLIKLRYPPVELNVISDRFWLRPAADALAARRERLALFLSLTSPRLFRFDGERAEPYGGIVFPESVYSFPEDKALDSGEGAYVSRSGVTGPQSSRELNEPAFFKELGGAIASLADSRALPLVLIGDDKTIGNFMDVYRHPQGMLERRTSESQQADETEVARVCADVGWEGQQKDKALVLELLRERSEQGKLFTGQLAEVFRAAVEGRIRLCAVACDRNVWRSMDGDRLRPASSEDEDAFEALDRIYCETLLTGGDAIVLPRRDIPGGREFAVVFK